MTGDAFQPIEPGPAAEPEGIVLRGLGPREIARLIRSLDSRLVGIAFEQHPAGASLRYRFEVAGKTQDFSLAVPPEALASIADLYPEAAARERELEREFGIRFRPPRPANR